VAHQLLRLADQHDLTVVEDDTYAWLAPPHATRLAQLDGLRRTVYVSGFSKILTPQWRVGYIAAAPELAQRFIDTKLLGTLTTPSPLEDALALCLDQGSLRRHAERVIGQLDAARARTVRLVRDAGLPLRCAAARAVRLGRCRPGHRRPGPAAAGQRLPDRTGVLVPCPPASDHADARELRRRPGRPVLAPVAGLCVKPAGHFTLSGAGSVCK
jgi:hypothetical protein